MSLYSFGSISFYCITAAVYIIALAFGYFTVSYSWVAMAVSYSYCLALSHSKAA